MYKFREMHFTSESISFKMRAVDVQQERFCKKKNSLTPTNLLFSFKNKVSTRTADTAL
jgi:hypothetical protein